MDRSQLNLAGIYCITNPEGLSYIGQTVNLYGRYHTYKSCEFQEKWKWESRIQNSIRKYGFSSHTFKVLEVCEEVLLNEREVFWIRKLSTLSPNGLNLREGGNQGGRLSQEVKDKLSKAHKGKTLSEEHKSKISNTLKGREHTWGDKISASCKGRVAWNKGKKVPYRPMPKGTCSNCGRSFGKNNLSRHQKKCS